MKIGAVPYINAFPLLRYLNRPVLLAPPRKLEELMKQGELDVALLPSFAFLDNPSTIPLYKVGLLQSQGPVDTVAVFCGAKTPELSQIRTIKYTNESVTSISLFKVLLNYMNPLVFQGLKEVQEGADAELVIGDKVLDHPQVCKVKHDLGQLWQKIIGLPFTYALWVASKPVSQDFIDELCFAKKEGLKNLDLIIGEIKAYSQERMHTYLTKNIIYEILPQTLEGLKKFRDMCFELKLLNQKREL
ncbi:MAG TPA: hypothetical protein DDW49_05310 [Deltaproteobacteria bacterium]|nr:MAG: hypothetical protein A2048_08810 [Deltaproteobacteria bacterium GWA2_45_12]HBF12794.1 hypothetical protein [Deltaproteobacteria bacterium]